MAYDETLAGRLRDALRGAGAVSEKKMFGGIAFMLNGNMCCGVINDLLMARVGPGAYSGALERPHARPMDFTKRPMKGYVYVEPGGLRSDEELREWVCRCVEFVRTLPEK
ncbi:MAG: TfoX/Sxy family protein [Candidatus Dadabacteria bacterium]|nr:TfoX/Sxy family protein [Candidatus Dadabacteria bacterium]